MIKKTIRGFVYGLFFVAACLIVFLPSGAKAASFAELAPATKMSFAELVGDNGDYRDIPQPPKAGTYKVVVNVYYQFVTVFQKDAKGKYTVPVRYMICSTGKRRTPTMLGNYSLPGEKYRFKSFEDFKSAAQYWTRIRGSTYFHSVTYGREDADVPQLSTYRNLGTRASHGCVRLTVPDARWIYYNIAPGTTVSVIQGKKDSKQAAIRAKLKKAAVPRKLPDLSAGKPPVTEAWPGYSKDDKLPNQYPVAFTGEITKSTCVYTGVSKKHGSVGTLKKGQKVHILRDGYSATYYRILFKDFTAYVPVSAVRVRGSDNKNFAEARTAVVKTTTACLKSKYTGGKTLVTLKKGAKVIVLAMDTKRARVIGASKVGYLPLSALKMVK
jgi:hypothetical protein